MAPIARCDKRELGTHFPDDATNAAVVLRRSWLGRQIGVRYADYWYSRLGSTQLGGAEFRGRGKKVRTVYLFFSRELPAYRSSLALALATLKLGTDLVWATPRADSRLKKTQEMSNGRANDKNG